MTRTPVRAQSRPVAIVTLAVLLVTGAVAPALAAAAVPESEPNDSRDTAQVVQSGETVTGRTEAAEDADWYAFEATRGETLAVDVFAGGNGDTSVDLFDPRGNTVSQASLSGDRATFGTTARYNGTYYLRLVPRFDAYGAEYNLTPETYRSDGFEPNEDRGNATRLAAKTPIDGRLTPGDTDWFAVAATSGDPFNVSVVAGSSGDTAVDLFHRNGTRVGDVSLSGQNATLSVAPEYDGDYYLRLSPRFGAFNATYTVSTDSAAAVATATETPRQSGANTVGGDGGTGGASTDGSDSSGGGIPWLIVALAVLVVALLAAVVARRG